MEITRIKAQKTLRIKFTALGLSYLLNNLRIGLNYCNVKFPLTLPKVLGTQNRSAINTTISLDACIITPYRNFVKENVYFPLEFGKYYRT